MRTHAILFRPHFLQLAWIPWLRQSGFVCGWAFGRRRGRGRRPVQARLHCRLCLRVPGRGGPPGHGEVVEAAGENCVRPRRRFVDSAGARARSGPGVMPPARCAAAGDHLAVPGGVRGHLLDTPDMGLPLLVGQPHRAVDAADPGPRVGPGVEGRARAGEWKQGGFCAGKPRGTLAAVAHADWSFPFPRCRRGWPCVRWP